MTTTLIDQLVNEHIADNIFHASHMLRLLNCYGLPTREARLERCRLYKAWKMAGENKAEARRKAIAGEPAPLQLFTEQAAG